MSVLQTLQLQTTRPPWHCYSIVWWKETEYSKANLRYWLRAPLTFLSNTLIFCLNQLCHFKVTVKMINNWFYYVWIFYFCFLFLIHFVFIYVPERKLKGSLCLGLTYIWCEETLTCKTNKETLLIKFNLECQTIADKKRDGL